MRASGGGHIVNTSSMPGLVRLFQLPVGFAWPSNCLASIVGSETRFRENVRSVLIEARWSALRPSTAFRHLDWLAGEENWSAAIGLGHLDEHLPSGDVLVPEYGRHVVDRSHGHLTAEEFHQFRGCLGAGDSCQYLRESRPVREPSAELDESVVLRDF
jgi:hypothetical protein